MKRIISSFLLALTLTGCGAVRARYWHDRDLNLLATGMTKAAFLNRYSSSDPNVRVPIVRASRLDNGQITEVLTLEMLPQSGSTIEYWFVFIGGSLVQWGRPEDWQRVAAKYQIDFNPASSVRPP